MPRFFITLRNNLSSSNSRLGKRKRNVGSLRHCSSKRAKLIREEALETKELVSNHECSQSTPQEEKDKDGVVDLCGIPLSSPCQTPKSRVTFVLEKASLTLAYVGKKYQILSSDEHADYLRKKKLNPYDYRPDIVFHALVEIMESRLRMTGKLEAVYIRTDKGVLIKIEPNAHIPETCKSFCNMMAQLLQKLSIKAVGRRKKLLSVVDNPITKHLPANSRIVGLSFSSPNAVQIREYISGISSNEHFVFVVGVMAHGKIDCDYIEDLISVSRTHLSASLCLSRIRLALERKLKIL